MKRNLMLLFIGAAVAAVADDTAAIQAKIDAAWRSGGGEAIVERGDWAVSSLRLRSGVTLRLRDGAHIWGAKDPEAYVGLMERDRLEPVRNDPLWPVFARRWENAIVRVWRAHDVAIVGEGDAFIDGANCPDPLGEGEEGYRGPHGISCIYSTNVVLRGFGIRRTGNWATRFQHCADLVFDRLEIRGGHDGVHVRGCERVHVTNCDLRTGDDSIAGFATRDMVVSNCTLVSACTPIRFGGRDVLFTDIRTKGPSEYPHRWTLTREQKLAGADAQEGEGRRNVGAFFQYFADNRIAVDWQPGNIVFRNCEIDTVSRFMVSIAGLRVIWQDGPTPPDIVFENVHARNVEKPSPIVAPDETPLKLTFRNCSFGFRTPQREAFYGRNFTVEATDTTYGNLTDEAVRLDPKMTISDVPEYPSWRIEPDEVRRRWGMPPLGRRTPPPEVVVVGHAEGALAAALTAARRGHETLLVSDAEEFSLTRMEDVRRTKKLGRLSPWQKASVFMLGLYGLAEKGPDALENHLAGVTNLTVVRAQALLRTTRGADGAIRSLVWKTVDAEQSSDAAFFLDATADGALVRLAGAAMEGNYPKGIYTLQEGDLVGHASRRDSVVNVAGDFPEVYAVPLSSFVSADVPNLLFATRRFAQTDAAANRIAFNEEVDAQAGWAAGVIVSSALKNRESARMAVMDKYEDHIAWEIITKGPFWPGHVHDELDKYVFGIEAPAADGRTDNRLVRLRDRARAEGLRRVEVPAGTYFLDGPLVLGPEDSGKADDPVVWEAKGRVVISAGRRVTGWTVGADGVWTADVPWAKERPFRQLSVNGEMRHRARHPNEGFFFAAADTLEGEASWSVNTPRWDLRYRTGDFDPGWRNPANGEIVSYVLWTDQHLKIQSVDAAAGTIRFLYPAMKAVWGATNRWWGVPGYRIENFREAMDEPGEWCLDRAAGRLHYLPRAGETPETAVVVAPYAEQALLVKGDPRGKGWCEHIVFRGFAFADGRYELPPGEINDGQSSWTLPGLVKVTGARNVAFEDCMFENTSAYAVEFRGGVRSCSLRRCTLRALGAGGVMIHGGSVSSHPFFDRCEDNEVSDCEIGDFGRDFLSGCGILQRNGAGSRIVHNHIHDGYYTGVSVGWVWGYAASVSRDNEVGWNHIHDLGKGVLSDMGGIYTLGHQPGSRLHHNHIHDIHVQAYGGWGIYNDEGTSYMTSEFNIVHHCDAGGYNVNYGKENVIRNNIFVENGDPQVKPMAREPHLSSFFERNVVWWTRGRLHTEMVDMDPSEPYSYCWNPSRGCGPRNERMICDWNLYFNPSVRLVDVRFNGKDNPLDWDGWRKLGYDTHSLWTDPRFVDPEKGDYRLRPDSPALALGFEPVDLTVAGPRTKTSKVK